MAKIKNNKLKIVNIILVSSYFFIVFLMLVYEIDQRRVEITDCVDNRLYAAASMVKYLLADDFHDRAIAPDAVSLDEERRNRQRLNVFASDNDFEWVYTLVEWGGNYYFTAPSVSEMEALERDSWYFYHFDEIPEEFIEVFFTGNKSALTYRDSWGVHRSAAVRERSSNGNVYLSCVEYNISSVNSEISRGILSSGLRFAIVALALIPFLFLNIIYNLNMNRLNFELNDYKHSLEGLVKDRTKELMRIRDELREQAIRDSLTGVYNRRFMTERLEEEMGRHLRNDSRLAMMMIDLDHFKEVNDLFGHVAGDRVLINITSILKENLREHDVFGRYGGDEFIILLPETDGISAKLVGEKLLNVVIDGIDRLNGNRVTLSIGVVEYIPGEDIHQFLARVDIKMYEAKKSRNTVCS